MATADFEVPKIPGMKLIPLENQSAEAYLLKGKLSEKQSEEITQYLEEVILPLLDERPEIKIFGRECRVNRNFAFFSQESEGYRFSGNIARSKDEMPEKLNELMKSINRKFETNFNGILVNYYPDGKSNIGRHADQMGGLNVSDGVLSISFGATRTFNLYPKRGEKLVKSLNLNNGSIVWMAGSKFQKTFRHEVPVESSVIHPRFSLTFRSYNK